MHPPIRMQTRLIRFATIVIRCLQMLPLPFVDFLVFTLSPFSLVIKLALPIKWRKKKGS